MHSLLGIFCDRHNELRVGWRLLLFLVLMSGMGLGVFSLLPHALATTPVVSSMVPFVVVLLVTWALTRLVNHKPLSAVGLWVHRQSGREFGIGLLLGFLMMSGIAIIEVLLGTVHLTWRGLGPGEVTGALGLSLVTFAFSAMFEELLFRGYLFQTLMQGVTFLPALIIMSVLFGIAHAQNPGATVLSTANVVLAGIWLSFAYLKTRSLWLPFGLHLSWNFSQTSVYSFPTSGFAFNDRRLFYSSQSGPEWLTGGDFGPEGGILATIALIAATWYILKAPYLNAPKGIVTLDSVEDILPPPPAASVPPPSGEGRS